MKAYFRLAMIICIVFGITMPQKSIASDKTYNWDFFIFIGPTHSIYVDHFLPFVNTVKERSNGKLNITLRPPGELPYKATDALKIVGDGSVQLADANVAFVAGESKIAAMPSLSFLIPTVEDLVTAMEVLEPLIKKDFDKYGADILFWYTWPPQNPFGKGDAAKSFEELKGRKFRTPGPEALEFLKRVGAHSVALTTPEVPTALQRGVVEGVFSSAFHILGAKWYEFLNWGYLPNHNMSPSYIVINKKALGELPLDLQKILLQTSTEFHKRMLKAIPASEEEAIKKLRELGLTITIPDTGATKKGQEIMVDFWESWAKQGGSEVKLALDKVRLALKR